jgi:hypothetical protein
MINYSQVLAINYPSDNWSIENNDYNTLVWYSDTPKPTQAELDALWPSTEETQAKSLCKQKAVALLQATDWTTIPDVANPSDSNPYLTNQREFMTWRSEIRQLAVNPVAAPVWPTQPTPTWGNKA